MGEKGCAWEKTFPWMAHSITVRRLNWLVTSASQRMNQGLIRMTTPFPTFLFLSFSLPPRLSDITHHTPRGNQGWKVKALALSYLAYR